MLLFRHYLDRTQNALSGQYHLLFALRVLFAELCVNLLPFHYKNLVKLMDACSHAYARKLFVGDFEVDLVYRVFLAPLIYGTFYIFFQNHTNKVRNAFYL